MSFPDKTLTIYHQYLTIQMNPEGQEVSRSTCLKWTSTKNKKVQLLKICGYPGKFPLVIEKWDDLDDFNHHL